MRRSLTTIIGLLAAAALTACSGPRTGTPPPPFAAVRADGNAVDLHAYRGNVVVMDFFATWCGPCHEATATIQELADEFATDDVVFIAFHANTDYRAGHPADDFAEREYTIELVPDGTDAARALNIQSIPTIVVLARDGTVVHTQTGLGRAGKKQLAAIIEENL